jgi:hypothetical protein
VPELVLDLDDDDYEAVLLVVAWYQRTHRVEGRLLLPDGEGDLRSRIIAEILRAHWWGAEAREAEDRGEGDEFLRRTVEGMIEEAERDRPSPADDDEDASQ